MDYGTELKNSGEPSIEQVCLLSGIKTLRQPPLDGLKKRSKNKATHQPPPMQGPETAWNQNVEKVK